MKASVLSNIVSDLLRLHECVTLPGFGAFVINPSGAQIDLAKNRFIPPGKRVSFNKNITNNDGLLANAISIQQGISYQDALVLLQHFVADIKQDLKLKSSFDFGEVGTFYRTREGLLKFEPNTFKQLSEFGMESFHLMPVENEAFVGKDVILGLADFKTVAEPRKRHWSKIGWGVAAIPLIAYLVWIPTRSGMMGTQKSFELSDLNPFHPLPCEEYEPRPAGLSPLDMDVHELLHPEFDESTFVFSAPDTTRVVVRESPVSAVAELRYQVIGGCFRNKSNAEKMVRTLKEQGFPAHICDKKNGLYRVSYAGYSSLTDARIALKEVKMTNNSAAWLLRK